MCFAVIFNKPFFCTGYVIESRFKEVLGEFGLDKYMCDNVADAYNNKHMFCVVDWNSVNLKWDTIRNNAISLVKQAFNM